MRTEGQKKEDAPWWGILLGDMKLLLGGDVTVGAVDGGGGQGVVVHPNLNSLPLVFGAGIMNVGEGGATIERPISDICHTGGDGDFRKASTRVERRISNARYTSVSGNVAVPASEKQRLAPTFNHTVICTVINRIFVLHYDIC